MMSFTMTAYKQAKWAMPYFTPPTLFKMEVRIFLQFVLQLIAYSKFFFAGKVFDWDDANVGSSGKPGIGLVSQTLGDQDKILG